MLEDVQKLKIIVHIHMTFQEIYIFIQIRHIHIFKNLRDILTNGYEISIPKVMLTNLSLRNASVSILYVRKLLDVNNELDLKLAPYLKESCLKRTYIL
jgi:hypothetical protein